MSRKTAKNNHRTMLKDDQLPSAEVENLNGEFDKDSFKGKLMWKSLYKLTDKQIEVIKEIINPDNKVIFIEGPAGSAKSYISVLAALKLIDQKKVTHLNYVRSIAESASKSIGALKGPQPLFSKIMTPNGWTTMGKIKKGDKVIAYDGSICKVLDTYDQGEKEVFKVTTNDGRVTHCCDDHAWFTQTLSEAKLGKKGSVKSLFEIRNSLMGSPLNKKLSQKINHTIPFCSPIPYEEKSYIIQPYTMGALLGDGSFSGSVTISSSDYEIPERIKKEANIVNCDLNLDYYKGDGSCINYTISSDIKNNKPSKRIEFSNIQTGKKILFNNRLECLNYFSSMTQNDFYKLKSGDIYNDYYVKIYEPFKSTNPIKNEIVNLGLIDSRSNTKFIPDIYKYGSIEQRISLLNGLMDTDGCACGSYSVFYTSSPQLANDVIQLVQSLGGTTKLRIRNRTKESREINGQTTKYNYLSYECRISLDGINPFYLKRKFNKYSSNYMHKIRIESVEPIEKMKTKCIKIDHPSHLYITDDFIVTHNTQDEKYAPFTAPLYDKIREIIQEKSTQNLEDSNRIQATPINFLRGASMNNTCLIVDEAQNMTMKELTTAITRIGKNSKFIFIGDPMQSDINGKSGFKRMFNLFDNDRSESEGIKCFSFTKDDIVRSGILKFIAEVLEEDAEDQKHKNQYQEQPPRAKHPRSQENPPVQSIWNVSDPSQDFPSAEKNGVFNNVKTFFKKFAT